MFKDFFKRRKMRVVAFGELEIYDVPCYVVFYVNDNDRRKYTIKGNSSRYFKDTRGFIHCEIWVDTGLLPTWAKDPVAEKLMR